MSDGRVFLLESPNALDLLEGTGETTSLSQVCKLFGHDIASFQLRDKRELHQTLMYIGSLGWRHEQDMVPIFIHFSAHGNNRGLAIGSDDVPWSELAAFVIETFGKIYSQCKPYAGPIILVVSACGTNGRGLCRHLQRAYCKGNLEWPPEYVFLFEDVKIAWQDAVVTWTMFYREAPGIDFLCADERNAVRKLLNRVHKSGYGNLRYFRWDSESAGYKTYAAKKRSS